FTVSAVAPGLFTDASGAVVPTPTAARGAAVVLYVTGAGAMSPAIATGAAPGAGTPVAQLPAPVQPLSVTIGGVAGTVQFAGVPAALVGVMQINVAIPATAPLGKQAVVVGVGGVSSVAGNITITAQ
ncbi:MAG TPA: peptidase S8, partial [Candidatus Solibacter sp.]